MKMKKHWLKAVRKTVCALAAGALALGASAHSAFAATPKEVNAAVDKAKAFIYSQMKADNWEAVPAPVGEGQADPNGKQWGGLTALATYGLLAAGEKPVNPKLAPAIAWLQKAQMGGLYATGIRAQVWTFLPEKDSKPSSKPDFNIFLNALHPEGNIKGLYPYYIDLKTGTRQKEWADHSVSQYGVLGMWACEQAGQEVPTMYWQVVDSQVEGRPAPRRRLGLPPRAKSPRATMTAAGIATLFITQDYMLTAPSGTPARAASATRTSKRAWPGWTRTSARCWPAANTTTTACTASSASAWPAGTSISAPSTGTRSAPTPWSRSRPPTARGAAIPDTVFATLFLVRGRAPVIMNKLEYAVGADAKGPGGHQEAGRPLERAAARRGQLRPLDRQADRAASSTGRSSI